MLQYNYVRFVVELYSALVIWITFWLMSQYDTPMRFTCGTI